MEVHCKLLKEHSYMVAPRVRDFRRQFGLVPVGSQELQLEPKPMVRVSYNLPHFGFSLPSPLFCQFRMSFRSCFWISGESNTERSRGKVQCGQ